MPNVWNMNLEIKKGGEKMSYANNPSVIANNIRMYRAKLGITQKELALKSGVCETSISFLENGKLDGTRMTTLNKLAEALKVNVSDFRK